LTEQEIGLRIFGIETTGLFLEEVIAQAQCRLRLIDNPKVPVSCPVPQQVIPLISLHSNCASSREADRQRKKTMEVAEGKTWQRNEKTHQQHPQWQWQYVQHHLN
jgi:hypothetical protein